MVDVCAKRSCGCSLLSLSALQSTYMASGTIDEAAVYQCTGNPLPQDVEQIINWLMNEDFVDCYNCKLLPQ